MKLPPIALGMLVGLACVAVTAPAANDALRDLRAARSDRATLAQLAAGPAPSRAIVVDGFALVAADRHAAADLLAARAREMAGEAGLMTEEAAPIPSQGLARVRLRVSGTEAAVIAFADRIERDRPIVRFASWRVVPAGARVTLTGELVAPWQ